MKLCCLLRPICLFSLFNLKTEDWRYWNIFPKTTKCTFKLSKSEQIPEILWLIIRYAVIHCQARNGASFFLIIVHTKHSVLSSRAVFGTKANNDESRDHSTPPVRFIQRKLAANNSIQGKNRPLCSKTLNQNTQVGQLQHVPSLNLTSCQTLWKNYAVKPDIVCH